jgi:hypothetical protein
MQSAAMKLREAREEITGISSIGSDMSKISLGTHFNAARVPLTSQSLTAPAPQALKLAMDKHELADRSGYVGEALQQPPQGMKVSGSAVTELGGQSWKMGSEFISGMGSIFGSKKEEPQIQTAEAAPGMQAQMPAIRPQQPSPFGL